MNELMKPVDEIIQNDLAPSTVEESITENERELYFLPTRSGGLDIFIFSEKAKNDFDNSVYITEPLVALIFTQEETLSHQELVRKRMFLLSKQS